MSVVSVYLAARIAKPFGQFNQANDVSTWNGATGCGQTSVQSVIYAFKKVLPSHDAVSRAIGYWRPADRRGTSAEQLAKGLVHWKLPYRASYGLTYNQLRALTVKGPVIVVVGYAKYPAWMGYRGRKVPAPWAHPAGKAGRNQFGVDFAHWVVFVGIDKGFAVVMEPNHDSPARPENVTVDYLDQPAFAAAIKAAYNGRTIAVIPTRSVA